MPWGSWGGTLPGPAGGVPCQVQPGGYPGLGWGTLAGGYPGQGGTLARGYPGRGVPWPGGVPCQGRGYPGRGAGTQLGQHREYLLHSGRYASCVHAGGLSCCLKFCVILKTFFSINFKLLWCQWTILKNLFMSITLNPRSTGQYTQCCYSELQQCFNLWPMQSM